MNRLRHCLLFIYTQNGPKWCRKKPPEKTFSGGFLARILVCRRRRVNRWNSGIVIGCRAGIRIGGAKAAAGDNDAQSTASATIVLTQSDSIGAGRNTGDYYWCAAVAVINSAITWLSRGDAELIGPIASGNIWGWSIVVRICWITSLPRGDAVDICSITSGDKRRRGSWGDTRIGIVGYVQSGIGIVITRRGDGGRTSGRKSEVGNVYAESTVVIIIVIIPIHCYIQGAAIVGGAITDGCGRATGRNAVNI